MLTLYDPIASRAGTHVRRLRGGQASKIEYSHEHHGARAPGRVLPILGETQLRIQGWSLISQSDAHEISLHPPTCSDDAAPEPGSSGVSRTNASHLSHQISGAR